MSDFFFDSPFQLWDEKADLYRPRRGVGPNDEDAVVVALWSTMLRDVVTDDLTPPT